MDTKLYSLAAQIEEEHWLFRGRRAVLRSVLDRYAPLTDQPRNILEVGCGNGGNFQLLASYGRLFAIEMDDPTRARATCRGLAQVEKGWLPDELPFGNRRFDLIAALDVIEHIEDDWKSIQALRSYLKPNGLLVMTVPAYKWLWSQHDMFCHHKRRYTRAQFVSLLRDMDFDFIYSTYFNTLLFPFAVVHIMLGKLFRGLPYNALNIPPTPLNRILEAIFSLESLFIPHLSFSYGLSILVCAHVKS